MRNISSIANSQAAKYYAFGLLNNGIAYAIFFALLQYGAEAKLSYTLVYICGTTASFIFNRYVVFKSSSSAGVGYILVWLSAGAAYLLNIAILVLFVDFGGYRAEIVQVFAMAVITVLLFFSNKYIVHR